jgi:HEPN domain-containing protein
MTIDDQIKYWISNAENDLVVRESLFQNEHFAWCLFIGHLVLEKTLKSFYIRDNQSLPPKTHDLVKLAQATKLILEEEKIQFLDKVNSFQIEARYPDYKSQFFKICTHKFAEEYYNKIKELHQWLKSQIIF